LLRRLFDGGFRVFFLLCGIYGCAQLLLWVAVLAGWMTTPVLLMPVWWHAHEMIFGFALAAVAGFLTTAVPAWTGTSPVSGGRLAALAAVWIAGRIAMMLSGSIPHAVVAGVDLLFIPCLALAITPAIVRSGARRNYGFPLVLAALLACNLAIHLSATDPARMGADAGLRFAVYLVIVMITVIGGRIVPVFTANALRRAGKSAQVRGRPRLGPVCVAALLLFAAAELFAPQTPWTGALGVLAAALFVVRMSGWQTVKTLDDPLVWSLHVGYAWIPLGLLLLALFQFGFELPRSAGIHALTAGAIGAMILAVTSRVALGHTGRPLVAPGVIVVAYVMISAGAALRVAAPLLWPAAAPTILQVAGLLWSGSFAVFTIVYAPILVSPPQGE
jgi:uncharacterized protein involved in response to NO